MRKPEEIRAELEANQKALNACYDGFAKSKGEKKDNAYAISLMRKDEALQDELTYSERFFVKVGDGVTKSLYSDKEAYTIIARTEKTITIRRCKATISKSFEPKWVVGGFSAICTNQDEQTWEYEENEKGQIEKARWSDVYGCFRTNSGAKIHNGRHEFYDYNF